MAYIGEWNPQSNLVGLWHLNGNSTDTSGGNFNLTDTAITYALSNGKFSQGASFNGSTSRMKINSALGLSYNSNIRINIWVKLNSEISSGTYFLVNRISDKGAANQSMRTYISYEYNSGTRRLKFGRDGGAAGNFTYNTTLGTTSWYMMTVVFDGTNVIGYVNGNAVGSTPQSGYGNDAVGNWFSIGQLYDAINSDLFIANASFDEVAIFSRALSASEIRKWYAHSVGKFQ